ncbi:MAG TPA: PIN domain-containing protein [Thermoanaerobaculia bacterium]|jgi:predicted nucleic acid-binding protein|nr:PIN domain-containing protein [Thermoanaerobaculia bacterium]
MNAPVFVDTNVLLYRHDDANPEKQEAAAAWLVHLWRTRSGRLSTQVLQEFYLNATQKLKPGLNPEMARREVIDLAAWHPISVDLRVIADAWDLQDRYQLSFWDCLIAAAAKLAGCRFLLTEDLQHDQDLNGVRVLNPFIARPGSSP